MTIFFRFSVNGEKTKKETVCFYCTHNQCYKFKMHIYCCDIFPFFSLLLRIPTLVRCVIDVFFLRFFVCRFSYFQPEKLYTWNNWTYQFSNRKSQKKTKERLEENHTKKYDKSSFQHQTDSVCSQSPVDQLGCLVFSSCNPFPRLLIRILISSAHWLWSEFHSFFFRSKEI